jgi:Asp/Glu/hydantoin racemase
MAERMTPGGYLNLTVADYGKLYTTPEPYLTAITQEARKIITQGADVLLLFGNPINMFAMDHNLREIDGVPILDVCGAAIKIAELMVDLKKMGITRSRSGLFSVPSKEEHAQLRKLYELQ